MFKFVFAVFPLFSIFSASVMANDPPDEKDISKFTSRDGFYLEATKSGVTLNKEYEFEFADGIDGRCWFEFKVSPGSNEPVPLNDKLVIGWEESGALKEESPVIIVNYGSEIGALTLHFLPNRQNVNTLECHFEGWGKGPDQITVGRLRSYFAWNILVQRLKQK